MINDEFGNDEWLICLPFIILTFVTRHSLLLAVLIPQPRLPILQRDLAACDEYKLDVCFHIQRITVRDYDVRYFPHFERAIVLVHSESLRRIERDSAQRFVIR